MPFLLLMLSLLTSKLQRFGPPRRKGPLNDGKDAFDASYLNYITDWWDHVCPQAGISLGGEFVNPLLVQAAQDPELNATMRGASPIVH